MKVRKQFCASTVSQMLFLFIHRVATVINHCSPSNQLIFETHRRHSGVQCQARENTGNSPGRRIQMTYKCIYVSKSERELLI